MSQDQQPIATPRTNSKKFWARETGSDSAPPHVECVYAEDMEELERELVQKDLAIQLLEHGKYGRTDMAMQILSLQSERDKLQQWQDAAIKDSINRDAETQRCYGDIVLKLQEERDKLKADFEFAVKGSFDASAVMAKENAWLREEQNKLKSILERVVLKWETIRNLQWTPSLQELDELLEESRDALNHSKSPTQ